MSRARRSLLPIIAAMSVGLIACATVAMVYGLRGSPRPILRYDPSVLLAAAPLPAAHPHVSAGRRTGGHVTVTADPRWVGATSRRTGIPAPAVRAYGVAALRVADEQPTCDLGWTTLAGVGYIESVNGTIGGRALAADGRSTPLILGPALDGKGGVAAIRATAQSTQWHGDDVWDHAVGPMQFIPSTWESWAADGDGDGVADPNDIDDAAYATALYLCADGHSLDGSGWSEAIRSYNHSDAYVREVYDAASAYAARAS